MKYSVLRAASLFLLTALLSSLTFAGKSEFFVFLENSPLQGVDVTVDGENIGQTNAKGEAEGNITTSGSHKAVFSRGEEIIGTVDFELEAEQALEVTIVISTSNEPKISIYKTGDDSTRFIGKIAGQIKAADSGALAGANVSVVDGPESVVTDENGNFSINIPRGYYDLLITHPDYQRKTIEDIRVMGNIGTAAVVTVIPKTEEEKTQASNLNIAAPLEEVIILGYVNTNDQSAFTLEQMSTAVVDVLDIEAIIRFGDSNVASALKRVVGISIKDGKYAVVRGLDGRYIAATLNKNMIPTTDPFVRDAELDLYPADILGGIEIQKSFSADLPAESSAGVILVKTRGRTGEYVNKLSVDLKANTETTGKDYLTSEGGDSDILGYDDGFRALPSAVSSIINGGRDFSICQVEGQPNCVTVDDAANAAAQLNNIWETQTKSASPGYGLGYTIGNVMDLDFGSLSGYFTISYDNEISNKTDGSIDRPNRFQSNFTESSEDISLNTYFVGGLELNDGSSVEIKTMQLRNTENTVRIDDVIDNEGVSSENTVIEWRERELFSTHLSGEHFLPANQEIAWRLGQAKTTSDIPDRRRYTYRGEGNARTLTFNQVERLWSTLEEDSTDFGLDYSIEFDITTAWRADVKAGILTNERERESELIRLGINRANSSINLQGEIETILAPENFQADGEVRLRGSTTDDDTYEADQETTAYYAASEIHFDELFTLVIGARMEDFSQSLEFPNRSLGNNQVDLEDNGTYPTVATIYRPNESWQIKAAYAQTTSRPTITELAPVRFYDRRGQQFQGNELLKTSDIKNYDLRLDYYFADEGNASVALFRKNISDPVEVGVLDGSGSAISALTWQNEDEATLTGIEFDFSNEIYNDGSHSMFIGANASIIDSEVVLTGDSARLQLEQKRQLQGLSEYLGNVQFGYDHLSTGIAVTFLANYFHDRIDQVRRQPEEVVYEKGRMEFDLVFEMPLMEEAAKVKLKIGNLLDSAKEFEQSGRKIESWKEGRDISVGFSYNF